MANPDSEFKLDQYILHHVSDSKEWLLPFLEPIHLPGFLTLHGVMLILCSLFLMITFCGLYNRKARVPTGITNFLEIFVLFIRDEIAVPSLGKEDGKQLTPLFCTFFFFILFLNIMGLIPVFSTATANYSVTGGLASITLFFMVFGAVYKNGIKGFLSSLTPSGVPIFVMPIIFLIEFLGLFIKSIALTIRLFANLLAGHIIIFGLLGVIVLMGLVALPTLALALFVYMLEILVAFIQAYIFTLLSSVFIGLTYHPDH